MHPMPELHNYIYKKSNQFVSKAVFLWNENNVDYNITKSW